MFARLRTLQFVTHPVSSLHPYFIEDLLEGVMSFSHFFSSQIEHYSELGGKKGRRRKGYRARHGGVESFLEELFLCYKNFSWHSLTFSLCRFLTQERTIVTPDLELSQGL